MENENNLHAPVGQVHRRVMRSSTLRQRTTIQRSTRQTRSSNASEPATVSGVPSQKKRKLVAEDPHTEPSCFSNIPPDAPGFPLFSKLPAEIRNQIWIEALPGPVAEGPTIFPWTPALEDAAGQHLATKHLNWIATNCTSLALCQREALAIAQGWAFEQDQFSTLLPDRLMSFRFFNPGVDAVYFSEECIRDPRFPSGDLPYLMEYRFGRIAMDLKAIHSMCTGEDADILESFWLKASSQMLILIMFLPEEQETIGNISGQRWEFHQLSEPTAEWQLFPFPPRLDFRPITTLDFTGYEVQVSMIREVFSAVTRSRRYLRSEGRTNFSIEIAFAKRVEGKVEAIPPGSTLGRDFAPLRRRLS